MNCPHCNSKLTKVSIKVDGKTVKTNRCENCGTFEPRKGK